jgi:hypothetical protein
MHLEHRERWTLATAFRGQHSTSTLTRGSAGMTTTAITRECTPVGDEIHGSKLGSRRLDRLLTGIAPVMQGYSLRMGVYENTTPRIQYMNAVGGLQDVPLVYVIAIRARSGRGTATTLRSIYAVSWPYCVSTCEARATTFVVNPPRSLLLNRTYYHFGHTFIQF